MVEGCGITRPVSQRVTESCLVPMIFATSAWEYGPRSAVSMRFVGVWSIPIRCTVVFLMRFLRLIRDNPQAVHMVI